MNERIEELAEQAGLKVESWMTNPPKPFQILGSTEDFEKFAELIVRECVSICDKRYVDIGQDGDGWLLARQIAEHFGVEE